MSKIWLSGLGEIDTKEYWLMQNVAGYVLKLSEQKEIWRCRFCGRANDHDKTSCPGCGAHKED